MCKISDLRVLVVDSDAIELQKTCCSLTNIGINSVFCVDKSKDALEIIRQEKDVHIVIAELRLDNFENTGIMLCRLAKETRPDIIFLVKTKFTGVSFVCQSILAGADATLDTSNNNEIEHSLPMWLDLVIKRINFRELIRKR